MPAGVGSLPLDAKTHEMRNIIIFLKYILENMVIVTNLGTISIYRGISGFHIRGAWNFSPLLPPEILKLSMVIILAILLAFTCYWT